MEKAGQASTLAEWFAVGFMRKMVGRRGLEPQT